MMVNGRTTTCMEKEFTPGKTAGNMKESMKMTESTVTESTLGMTVSNMPAGGLTANSTVKVSIEKTVETEEASGKKARELNGSKEKALLEATKSELITNYLKYYFIR